MPSIEKCRQILNRDNKNKYTEEEIKKIKMILEILSELDYSIFKEYHDKEREKEDRSKL